MNANNATTIAMLIKSDLSAVGSGSLGIGSFLFAYLWNPSFYISVRIRLIYELRKHGFLGRIVSKMLWKQTVAKTSCHISSQAQFGQALVMPHPTAIVIGDGVVTGDNVTIFQGVTIGLASGEHGKYPVIGSNVKVYANAVIIGCITIGDNSIIAANAVVISSVPPNSLAAGVPAVVKKTLL